MAAVERIPWQIVMVRAQKIRVRWQETHDDWDEDHAPKVYGVPRGGCVIAPIIGWPVDRPGEADLIVDDLVDSGATRDRYKQGYPTTPFEVLFDKTTEPEVRGLWLEFPWEESDPSTGPVDHLLRLLQLVTTVDTSTREVRERAQRIVERIKSNPFDLFELSRRRGK